MNADIRDYTDLVPGLRGVLEYLTFLGILFGAGVILVFALICIMLSRMPAGEREPTLTEVILERNKPLRWPLTDPPKDVQGPPLTVKAKWKKGEGK